MHEEGCPRGLRGHGLQTWPAACPVTLFQGPEDALLSAFKQSEVGLLLPGWRGLGFLPVTSTPGLAAPSLEKELQTRVSWPSGAESISSGLFKGKFTGKYGKSRLSLGRSPEGVARQRVRLPCLRPAAPAPHAWGLPRNSDIEVSTSHFAAIEPESYDVW